MCIIYCLMWQSYEEFLIYARKKIGKFIDLTFIAN